jgi:hypothetical protein
MAVNAKSEYFGRSGTSTAGIDLIQLWKQDANGATLVANVFNFIPTQACTIKINGSDPIPFPAGKEFNIDTGINPNHRPLWQFQITEANIDYWFMGIFK